MNCIWQEKCGGCPLRGMDVAEYKKYKEDKFNKIIQPICEEQTVVNAPIFIDDGLRRRAEFAFLFNKNGLHFGFNAAKSHDIADIEYCAALCGKINDNLQAIRDFLSKFCRTETTRRVKNKTLKEKICQGDLHISACDNGLDMVIFVAEKIALEHRLLICDFANRQSDIIRISVGIKGKQPETVIEKLRPYVDMAGTKVLVASGTFLQASAAGQDTLIGLVRKYIGDAGMKIADLFCGIGTFSYPLAQNIKNKITAIDVSTELLSGFRQTVNYLSIPNIKTEQKNLFKYPLTAEELTGFDVVIFDPPRAGAAAQVRQIAAVNQAEKPQKVVAISCNPHTFVNDAGVLMAGGYRLKEITMVDQFVFTEHFELVALFEKK